MLALGRLDDLRGENERLHHEIVDQDGPGLGWRRRDRRRNDAIGGGCRRARRVAVVDVVVPGDGEGVLVEVTVAALTRGRDAGDAVVPPVQVGVGGIGSRRRWRFIIIGCGSWVRR